MKVVFINAVCGTGSTGRIVMDLYTVLKQKGCQAKIAYGDGNVKGINNEDLFKINNKIGYYSHNAFSRITDRAGFYSSIQTKRLIKWIDRENPDIVHLHNLHGYYLNIKMLFSYLRKTERKVIWTLHDCWAFTGHCSYFSYVGCEKWRTECKECVQKTLYPQSILFDQSRRNYKEKKELLQNIFWKLLLC